MSATQPLMHSVRWQGTRLLLLGLRLLAISFAALLPTTVSFAQTVSLCKRHLLAVAFIFLLAFVAPAVGAAEIKFSTVVTESSGPFANLLSPGTVVTISYELDPNVLDQFGSPNAGFYSDAALSLTFEFPDLGLVIDFTQGTVQTFDNTANPDDQVFVFSQVNQNNSSLGGESILAAELDFIGTTSMLSSDALPTSILSNVTSMFAFFGTSSGFTEVTFSNEISLSFGAATNFPVGSSPRSVASGDLNGDGKPDLAAANFSSDNVSILLGDGSGAFGAAANFAAGSNPSSIAIGDLNDDGKPDLAVGNFSSNNVSILLGAGTGSFGAATSFAAGLSPSSVAIGDLNGDGKPDLAVANANSANVSILLGDGSGSFAAATNFAAGAGPFSVAIGDLNGDGKPDLAVANVGSADVSILLGTGSGSFGAATNFAAGAGPFSVAIGDLNGDGKSDLAVANQDSADVSILLGDGSGSFGAATNFAVGTSPFSVAIGDLNGDGKPDLAVANQGSSSVSTLLGTGSGSFGAATNFAVGTNPRSVAIEDLDGDGRRDLAVANAASSNVSILLNTTTFAPSGTFGAATSFAAGTNPRSVAIGDLNSDGKPDLAVANANSANVSILLGTGTGSFGTATNFTVGTQPISVAIGDLNGDGKPDLAVANANSANVSILLGTGTGSFGAATNFAEGTNARSVAIEDLDGDGRRDLAVANISSGNVSILLGTGTGSFAAATNFFAGGQPVYVAIGDLNVDGKPDLAVADAVFANVSILLGTGTGSFAAALNFAVGTQPDSVAIGDLNGDGKPDLAVANVISANVSILLGTGTGSFAAATNFAVGTNPFSVAIGDLNGDGQPDLAVANTGSASVSILLGTGTGSFGAAMNFAAGTNPFSVAIGDLNGDGRLDLAVANFLSNDVSILLNTVTLNQAPTATSVSITGTAAVGQLLTGQYTYGDVDGDLEGTSTFRWLLDGTVEIGTAATYTVVGADLGHSITFEVTPAAATGASPGAPATSAGVAIPQGITTVSINNLPGSGLFGGNFTPAYDYIGDGTTSTTTSTAGTCTVTGGVVNFVGVGACTLTAHATAGTNYAAVDGSPQSLAIGQTSITLLVSTQNPSASGQSVLFAAIVISSTGGTPTGSVIFLDNGIQIGMGALDSSGLVTFSTSSLSVGSHPITAQYLGDPSFAPSTSAVITQIVDAIGTSVMKPTFVALGSSPNPSAVGQSVLITAAVNSSAGGVPTGTVSFLDNGASIGTAGLNGSGVASFSTSSLGEGTHPITAQYFGDGNFTASLSAVLIQGVGASAPQVTVQITPIPQNVAAGTSVQYKATVENAGSNTGVTWELSGPGGLDSTGKYTAPDTITQVTVTVSATSIADPSKKAVVQFTIAADALTTTQGPATIPAGSQLVVAIQLAGVPGDSTVPFALSCSNLPLGATCQFDPDVVTGQNPDFTFTIITADASSGQLLPLRMERAGPWAVLLALALLAMALVAGSGSAALGKRSYACGVLVLLCFSAVFLSSCSGISPSSVAVPAVTRITPTGKYQVLVTATPQSTTGGFVQTQLIVPFTVN